jgi:cytochrome d ubiquinol oxidase subunit II
VNILAFGVLAFMIVTYAVLDGYDLGVGTILHLFGRSRAERAAAIESIGPFWNGNEVWLIAAGGVLFACFPQAYATAFSGFYLPFMVLLWLLMLRGIALELRDHFDNELWQNFWDATFSFSSAALALILGVAVGNVLQGLPLDAAGYFTGSFAMLLNPYALTVGALALLVLAQHGLCYLSMNCKEGRKRGRLHGIAWWLTVVLYLAVTAETLASHPLGAKGPFAAVLGLIAVGALFAVRIFERREAARSAFFASTALIVALLGAAVVTIYPFIIPATAGGTGISIFAAAPPGSALLGIIGIAVAGLVLVSVYSTAVARRFAVKASND